MSQNLQNPADHQQIPSQVFNPLEASKTYHYSFIPPSKQLEQVVDSHWAMHWDLSNKQPFKLELASSPFIAFTFTPYGNFVTGISTGMYEYTISGVGVLYGTLFKPTRFYGLFGRPLSELTDKELPLASIFPSFDAEFGTKLAQATNDHEAIVIIEAAIAALPQTGPQENCVVVEDIIKFSLGNPTLSVKQIAREYAMSERRLHQLFHDYVGVGIKWITIRDRLQKAMTISLRSPDKPNWTLVAQELGYSDQPHFINDFKRVIGMSPSQYYQLLQRTR